MTTIRPPVTGSTTTTPSTTSANVDPVPAPAPADSVTAPAPDSFDASADALADLRPEVRSGLRFSENVVAEVMQASGVTDVNALIETAAKLDDGNRYLKRSELEAAAKELGRDDLKGYRWSPAVLARVMTGEGLDDEMAVLHEAVKQDDGNRYLKRSELEAAAKVLNGRAVELGYISDLDKTVIPPKRGGLPDAAYPGVALLYHELEFGNGGKAGDAYYVTARSADRLTGIATWLDDHKVPAGPIEPGTSPLPWVAQPEKVNDISRILDAHPDQNFVLMGDTNHRDPEVFQEILAKYPGRIKAALVHRVKAASDDRVDGLGVYSNYAEAAALLFQKGVLDESQARRVMEGAQIDGLDVTDAQIEALLASHQPG